MTVPEPSAVTIRPMHDEDWPAVQEIYREGIATGQWRDTILIERRSPAI